MENLKVNVVDTNTCSITLDIEVPENEVKVEADKVYGEIQKSAQVPGFRAGKAPMDMIKKNYSVTAREKVIENLIQRSAFSALHSKSVEPIRYPRVENITFDFGKPFSFRLRAERHPECKAEGYKGIKIKKEIIPVTDEKVRESIKSLQDRNAQLVESKSEAVSSEHFLVLDYKAFAGDEPVKELTANGQLMDLSAPQTIAGFKEGLAGAKKGEDREVKVKFPAEHPDKKIAGNEVVFKVTVKDIKEKVLPSLDDEFAKDLGVESLAELETKMRQSLELEENNRQNQEMEKQIVEQLLKSNEFGVPDTLVEEQFNYIMTRSADYFRRQGVPESAWKENVEKLKDKYREQAVRDVRLSYIFNAIAEQEKIEVAEEDLKKELENLNKSNPGHENEVEKYFTENKERISSRLRESKIFEFIISQAKIK